MFYDAVYGPMLNALEMRRRGSPARLGMCLCIWSALIPIISVGNTGDCFLHCGGLVGRDFTVEMDRVWIWLGAGVVAGTSLS